MKEQLTEKLAEVWSSTKKYLTVFFRWTFLSCFVGVSAGFIGAAFYTCVNYVTGVREATPMLIFLLPFAGLVIAFLYRIMGMKKDPGTNLLIESVLVSEQKVPQRMAVLIFISTVITHLFGGSVGRESASLQLGGCCGSGIGRIFHLDEKDMKLITMCGMSAMFAAVFGTPITATVFVMEFISVGVMHYSALLPCLTASVIAKLIANYFHLEAEAFVVTQTVPFDVVSTMQIMALGACCALAGIVFCWLMHTVNHALAKRIPNGYVRIFFGGCLVLLGTVLVGNTDYNGAGAAVMERAIEGEAVWYAFLLKMLFTAVTIGAGYKGGEIVPSFFIGATMGCVVGPLLGLPASFSAGLCLVGVFCAVVNCPLASIILSVEMFGADNMLYFAIVCVVSYMLSGPFSLYSSQRLMYSKLQPTFINQKTM